MSFLLPHVTDILDVIIMSVLIYFIIQLIIKKAGGLPILLGISLTIFLYIFATFTNLKMVSSIFRSIKDFWLVLFIVLFQTEIRNTLAKLGQGSGIKEIFKTEKEYFFQTIYHSVSALSFLKRGALIVFEKNNGLDEFINNGETIDAALSHKLLLMIFNTATALHDGAVIIRKGRIHAVKVVLPLSNNVEYIHQFGTRHLAGIGLTEQTDAFVIIVSEETGRISFAKEGVIYPNLSAEELQQKLRDASDARFSRIDR